ncbi:Peroxyureidoacrylate/ureidoacrylate amidohydrolase [Lachnellula hyalina]|uniref:Peroxyureidoacrylate/ureidoacrylate amidohydrolase n=1 Tax=Lachnellula hyalina TaxID=1316788 RepID=A0A8H8QXN7_9HELO|nr:Peroxyureidoacrylate/ureidoacrylate amidohydrolase [Lachnellula hyalina]TVY24644.1 Peroxyureidoacrylate/ureidoacrylate amidohydrolase [Lachnellula hyalina]
MGADLTFGPSNQQWHYSPSSKTYDLSGDSPRKLTIAATEEPEETFFTISPEATALVIIDMQNFFLDAKCMDHPNGLKAVEPTIKIISKCREAGIQIIWVNWGLTDQDLAGMPAGVMRGFMADVLQCSTKSILSYTGLGSDLGGSKGRCLVSGTWNADIYEPLKAHVRASDLHCAKSRMSGLWTPEQPLWKTLKERKKSTVMFAGVNTDQCVLGTLVDGYNAVSLLMADDQVTCHVLASFSCTTFHSRGFSKVTNTPGLQRVGTVSWLTIVVALLRKEPKRLHFQMSLNVMDLSLIAQAYSPRMWGEDQMLIRGLIE